MAKLTPDEQLLYLFAFREIEECWRNEREINSIDLDVQTQFRQELIDALAKRSAKGE